MPLSGHDDVALWNDVANDAESTQNRSLCHIVFASLKSGSTLLSGWRLLISNLPGSASRTHVES